MPLELRRPIVSEDITENVLFISLYCHCCSLETVMKEQLGGDA